MFRGLGDIFQTLGSLLPPWALALVALLLAVVAGPSWFDNVRIKQVRGRIRKMLRATTAERVPLAEQALVLAAARPARLVALVREAHKYDLRDLRDEALRRLHRTGRAPEDVRVLRELVQPKKPTYRDPLQAVVKVERLLGLGLVVGAREELELALAQHPEDADLQALDMVVTEAAAQSSVPEGAGVPSGGGGAGEHLT